MPITSLQNKPIIIGTPVEIESAVNDLRVLLSGLTWVSHPYFIAKRFVEDEKGKKYIYPETYCKDFNLDPAKKYPYHRLTPDNDYTGMFFAYVSSGKPKTRDIKQNYISYNVSFIFSVNLELIDETKLNSGVFTCELMSEARKLLSLSRFNYGFDYSIITETDDLQEVYREFRINELERYNRAPMQCFRFDLEVVIEEDCF